MNPLQVCKGSGEASWPGSISTFTPRWLFYNLSECQPRSRSCNLWSPGAIPRCHWLVQGGQAKVCLLEFIPERRASYCSGFPWVTSHLQAACLPLLLCTAVTYSVLSFGLNIFHVCLIVNNAEKNPEMQGRREGLSGVLPGWVERHHRQARPKMNQHVLRF